LPLITEFVRRMDAELPHVGFMFNSQVSRFTRELAEAIGAAQAHRAPPQRITVWFGFESGSQRLLDFMDKRTTVEQGLEVARFCADNGVQVGANILLGVPTETADDYAAHDEFLARIRPTFPNPNILNPLPGTRMHRYCVELGLLHDPHDLSIWSAEKIRDLGRGPVKGVDYDLVLDAYSRYRLGPVRSDQKDQGSAGPRYQPWAGD
jgi:hypothetical protein